MPDEIEASSPGDGEVTFYVADDGLLCVGDRSVVDTYITALQHKAGQSLSDLGITRQSLLDVAAAGSALAALHAAGGEYFRMAPSSLAMFKELGAIPGADGYFKGTVRAARGQWGANLDFQQVDFGPTEALSLQLAIATASLRAAIKDVQRAVERVEGKVDDLVARAEATALGEVIGTHRLLERHVAALDQTGVLPETTWQSVAGLGPQLAIGIEKLRQFMSQRVKNLDPAKPAADRAKRLRDTVERNHLGEVLQLLVVAEDSHYLWHRLSIEHARATEPDNLEHVINSARTLLRNDVTLDQELLDHLRPALEAYATLRPLEKHRVFSGDKLANDIQVLRKAFNEFALARQMQVIAWLDIERPTWTEVGTELGSRANELGRAARDASTKLIGAADEYATRTADVVVEQARVAGEVIDLRARRAANAVKDALRKHQSHDD